MTDCFVAVAAPRRALLRCRVLAAPAPGFMIVAIQPLVEAMHTAKTCVLLLLVGVATSAAAHHSAAQFDFSKTVLVEGTVKVLEVRNPHVKLVLGVSDAAGVRDIEYEGHSRNNVYRRGWRPEHIQVGDAITIGIAPLRSGGDGGYVTSFKLADGTEF